MSQAAGLGSLYQALILEHYRRPRNQGDLPDADARVHMNNPTCGDEIELSLKLREGRVSAVRFRGQGCSISQASASMMTEALEGKTLAEADALAERFKQLLRTGEVDAGDRSLGNLRVLSGVASYPPRVRCALLAWNAFEEAARAVAHDA
jgi:nitrogen fixation protein NifU and related proteins